MRLNRRGFTLVELSLAMALFLTVLMLTTSGFIALSRTYTRGTVRRELSQTVQSTAESLTRAIRSAPPNVANPVTPCSGGNCLPNGATQALALTSACYFWNNSDTAPARGGLYLAARPCSASAAEGAQQLADQRYIIQSLTVERVTGPEVSNLYRIKGVVRTANNDSFNNVGTDNVTCKGSSVSSYIQLCAVEKFNFIVSSRGEEVS